MTASRPAGTVSISSRFNGPPESSNGGYACGVVARLLGARAAEVTLRKPPPLERPLAVEREAGGGGETVRLLEGDAAVAEGRPLPGLDVDPPERVSVEAAREASRGFPGYEGHAFPTCFVCGPRRGEGDGLRIFAGSVTDGRAHACDWTPSAEWGDDRGHVRPEIAWAALDCPSAVAAAALADHDAPTAVLARLAASLDHAIPAGEPHVVLSWPLGRDGRKRTAGSAILTAEGAVLARARALWIEVPDDHGPARDASPGHGA